VEIAQEQSRDHKGSDENYHRSDQAIQALHGAHLVVHAARGYQVRLAMRLIHGG
jgi:hypothetical protein